jgi:hypothetical protein
MGAVASSAIGIAGGLFSMNQSAKAQKQAYDQSMAVIQNNYNQQMGFASPYMQAGRQGLPGARALQNIAMAQVGKNDPFLQAEHQQNMQSLARNQQYNMDIGNLNFMSKGNLGAGIGNQIRARNDYTNNLNAENLNYGRSQQAFKQQNFGLANNLTNNLVQLGQFGTGMASNATNQFTQSQLGAIGMQAQGAQDNAGALGAMFGQVAGLGLDQFRAQSMNGGMNGTVGGGMGFGNLDLGQTWYKSKKDKNYLDMINKAGTY